MTASIILDVTIFALVFIAGACFGAWIVNRAVTRRLVSIADVIAYRVVPPIPRTPPPPPPPDENFNVGGWF